MAPFYEFLCKTHGWIVDEDLLARLKCVPLVYLTFLFGLYLYFFGGAVRAANAAELEGLQASLKDAEENQGETEVWCKFEIIALEQLDCLMRDAI